MHIVIPKQKILKLLNAVNPVIGSTKTIKVTECVKVTALGGKCIIAATDLTTTIKAYKDAEVKMEGEACVSGKAFHDIIHSLPDVDVTLKMTGNRFSVSTGKSQFNLNVTDPESFPNTPNYSQLQFAPFPDDFFEKTKLIMYAASKDFTRPALNSICVKPTQIATTDGHRLAIMQINTPIEGELLIDAESITNIQKALSHGDGKDIGFVRAGTEVHFLKGDVAITTRALSVQYPDVNQVIPQETPVVVQVKLQDLRGAIKRMLIVSEKKMSQVDFHAEHGELVISSHSQDVGECTEKLECEQVGVADFRLNGSFLEDALTPLKSEIVTLEYRAGGKPIVVKENEYLALVMPQRK